MVRILNDKEEAIPPGLFLNIAKKVKRYADIEKVLIDKSFNEIEASANNSDEFFTPEELIGEVIGETDLAFRNLWQGAKRSSGSF